MREIIFLPLSPRINNIINDCVIAPVHSQVAAHALPVESVLSRAARFEVGALEQEVSLVSSGLWPPASPLSPGMLPGFSTGQLEKAQRNKKSCSKKPLNARFKAGAVKGVTAALRMFFTKFIAPSITSLWQILELRFTGDFHHFLLTTVFPQSVGSRLGK